MGLFQIQVVALISGKVQRGEYLHATVSSVRSYKHKLRCKRKYCMTDYLDKIPRGALSNELFQTAVVYTQFCYIV